LGREDNPTLGREGHPSLAREENPTSGLEDNPASGLEDNPTSGLENNPHQLKRQGLGIHLQMPKAKGQSLQKNTCKCQLQFGFLSLVS